MTIVRLKFTNPKNGEEVHAEFEDVEHALEFQRSWFDGTAIQTEHALKIRKSARLSDNAIQLLMAVYRFKETGIESGKLSEELGVEPYALGPIISELTQWAAQQGWERKDILLKLRKNIKGKACRIYQAGKLLEEALELGVKPE